MPDEVFSIELSERRRPGRRLGRHVEHDPRSRAYPAPTAPISDVRHVRHGSAFNQGELGSCTGNAMAGALMTEPFYRSGRRLGETEAIALYELATKLDHVAGEYPPDDTGSTGLAVAKAAREDGHISRYTHAFGLHHALGALTAGPVIAGIHWYDSFDEPTSNGECPLPVGAKVRGGHEIELFGIQVQNRRVWCYQSWGARWGGLGDGTFWFSWETFERLLGERGDVTAFVA